MECSPPNNPPQNIAKGQRREQAKQQKGNIEIAYPKQPTQEIAGKRLSRAAAGNPSTSKTLKISDQEGNSTAGPIEATQRRETPTIDRRRSDALKDLTSVAARARRHHKQDKKQTLPTNCVLQATNGEAL